jgi:hypothetical protein
MTRDFLSALFTHEQSGVLELRPLKPYVEDARLWAQVNHGVIDFETVDHFVALSEQHAFNAYFGVALRSRPNVAREEPLYASIGTFYADLDFDAHPEDEAREALHRFPLPASMIVHSGGGLHAYWLLREALTIVTPNEARATAQVFDRFNRALLVADQGVKDLARVLRLPGTVNRKYQPSRPVTIERLDADRRYDVGDLLVHCPRLDDGGCIGESFRVREVTQGGRHDMLYTLGRSIIARGVPIPGAIAVCLAENERLCSPPLPARQLVRYLRRVLAYGDRSGFERSTTLSGLDVVGALMEIGVPFAAARLAGLSLDPQLDEVLS